MTDKDIRGWILNEPSLYQWAREYGGGGDEEMAEKLDDFVDEHRDELIAKIKKIRGK